MTDISESGIEAAYHKASEAFWEQKRAGGPYSATKHCIKRAISAAIQAYLPFHPPASREEGLRVKALGWVKFGVGKWGANGICGSYVLRLVHHADTLRDVKDLWYVQLPDTIGPMDYTERSLVEAKSAAQEHYTNAILSAIETALIPTKPEAKEPREVSDEIEVLRRLADGDALAYSRDGDNCWFTNGDRAWVAEATVIAMRDKGYLRRSWAADDPWGTDGISDAGRAALQSKKPE